MSPSPCPPSLSVISKCTVYPAQKSTLGNLKLSVSDLPMLSCMYIQKGVLFTRPPMSINAFVALLKQGLAQTLTHFPPLSGRLVTDASGYVYISCNDSGVHFVHANAGDLTIRDILSPSDVPDSVKLFFTFDETVSYEGHFRPIVAVQVTELADGVFVGCTVNHAVTDGTSFWNFFNSLAEVCRGVKRISRPPDFTRNYVKDSQAVLEFADGGPKVSFDANAPIRERIFHFSREAIQELKARANGRTLIPIAEIIGKQSNDELKIKKGELPCPNGRITSSLDILLLLRGAGGENTVDRSKEISSFQALSSQLWRSVTRARKLNPGKETTFRMAVNCRHRIEPRMDPYYFGNAIQSIRTAATAGELLSRDLQWCAGLLHGNVVVHDDATVRKGVEAWEQEPRVFPLGNPDGASITMGSSPRFPMYDNDFGWGRPVAVRSGRANKFDGKISAFPGREGGGSVDLEVCLAPETMSALEADTEFMQYVSASTARSLC
ncbi:BAHD acyltransferase DCR-like [Aristolochia californica]|uniref:BAHD acyltransferase DCR-like n=1 Tax=Aristolochia californica TaxID=171875 RepID=UPI0035DDA536